MRSQFAQFPTIFISKKKKWILFKLKIRTWVMWTEFFSITHLRRPEWPCLVWLSKRTHHGKRWLFFGVFVNCHHLFQCNKRYGVYETSFLIHQHVYHIQSDITSNPNETAGQTIHSYIFCACRIRRSDQLTFCCFFFDE